ncbi:hypothetical protein [Paenibacillus sp. ISL-20]|uniref:hypothetical protein n=1 Tax=Paenibacillus sp. ISL-20 TaxID=2819163 RepID=UPI001BE7523D|nr:hypothetical protein [Paenibacillus sp. ISL-20]MBT2759884.1 hypothetical protein [Paenibacillus sp. ISL-20]
MGLTFLAQANLSQQHKQCEGYGKCFICDQLSAITYKVNHQGRAIEESKECYSCNELNSFN